MRLRTLTLLLAPALASCTAVPPVQPVAAVEPAPLRTTFDPSEVAFIHEQGTNTITGSAFVRQRGGGVVHCAGNPVSLIPKGAYSAERIGIIYGTTSASGYSPAMGTGRGTEPVPPVDAYRSHQRHAICDIDGKFGFQDVATGSYFVVTSVTWTVGSYSTEGGSLMVPVTFTGNDEEQNVVLSPSSETPMHSI